ncbi:phosphoglycerate mutase [Nitrosovibrio tenuis]|uniref:Phosphoglycerate mutase n=1 Tax=Nitrosovibrio tenuis TaxID=1233 RepID=A0A1H7GH91_9PROT|nr:phosphoglycerate mutase [Nitrosovibrio tenuis]SEK35175.1 hypothetical protein SAMN05216387_101226 [Nitrosovibrio tenuis]
MNLQLLLPSLFWPDPTLTEIYRDLSLPSLENLLAKSSAEDEAPEFEGFEAWLCKVFNVTKQQDWPVAPVTLAIDGTEEVKAGDDYWIRADPVHLRIEGDQLVLGDSRIFKISAQEADQFTVLLNRHFATSGLEIKFFPQQPDRWYVCATKIPPAKTHLLSQVANKSINELLPFSANSEVWRGLFNESQMLLHDHPLNQLREARGEPAINSVWFWGGGFMPKPLVSPYTHVWSNDVLACSLARACGTDHAQLPPDAKAWHQVRSGNHLVVLDVLRGQAQYADAYGWRESLKKLELSWFEPLLTVFKHGRIDKLILTVVSETRTTNFTARTGDLRKFWRRTKPVSAYAG